MTVLRRALLPTLLVATLSVTPRVARAQSATVEMTADRTQVAVGETLRVQVRADVSGAEATDFAVPEFDAFQVVSRRVARPMQFRFGFGNQQRVVQSSTVYDFTLRALSEGTFRIEPAKVTVGGRTHRSDPLSIVVGPGSGGAPPPVGPSNATPPAGQLDAESFDSTAFLRTVVDRSSVHVGEQVTATVYLYSRGGIRSSPTVHEEPRTDGFWVHDLLPPNRMLEPHRQVVRGTPFNVYVLRRFAAFPLEAGELALGGMEITLRSGSVFDIFNSQSQDVRRAGAPAKIQVEPLPDEGRPGGPVVVGSFELEGSLDRTQVATGDAVTYRMILSGTGNVRDARAQLPDLGGLRVLQPQVTDDIESPGDRVGGSRTWEWLIIPEEPGNHRIPPVEIHTFDPGSDTYRTLRSEARTLLAAGNALAADVEEASTGDQAGALSGGEQDAPRLGPIRNRSELGRGATMVSSSRWFWIAAAIPPLSWLLLVLGGAIRRRAVARGLAMAPERVVKSARRKLARAEEHAADSNPSAFYGEVFQVLKDVLEARLGEPVGGFTHAELRSHLIQRGMPEDLVGRLVDELEGLEFARFSASGIERAELESCTGRVQALLQRLDRFTPTPRSQP